MTESKFSKRQRLAIQRIIGYKGSECVDWDVIEQHPDTAVLLVNVGRVSRPLTDMDWDMAMNDPSRLNKKDTPPHTTHRIEVYLNRVGEITGGEIIGSTEVKAK